MYYISSNDKTIKLKKCNKLRLIFKLLNKNTFRIFRSLKV